MNSTITCQAIAKSTGQPCKHGVSEGETHCYAHGGKTKNVRPMCQATGKSTGKPCGNRASKGHVMCHVHIDKTTNKTSILPVIPWEHVMVICFDHVMFDEEEEEGVDEIQWLLDLAKLWVRHKCDEKQLMEHKSDIEQWLIQGEQGHGQSLAHLTFEFLNNHGQWLLDLYQYFGTPQQFHSLQQAVGLVGVKRRHSVEEKDNTDQEDGKQQESRATKRGKESSLL